MSDHDQLLDFACVDLIQRNRRGDSARVESYFKQYPDLVDSVYALDLIDAEICVRKELGEHLLEAEWVQRFPQYAGAIRQLVALDVPENQLAGVFNSGPSQSAFNSGATHERYEPAIVSHIAVSDASNDAGTVAESRSRVDELLVDARKRHVELFPSAPIQLPDGFVIDCGVAMRPGVWLLRCHDEHDRKSHAFKVVDVAQSDSLALDGDQRKLLLDAYERAAKVRHPIWVPPVVASCDGCYVGVVRPWMFSIPWNEFVRSMPNDRVFRSLAELAFCLHAAHQSDCYHGNVCESNLFISHNGQLQLTDAATRFTPSAGVSDPALADALMFTRLVAAIQLDPHRGLSTSLVSNCHQMVLRFSADRMAIIGEWLIKIADGDLLPAKSTASSTGRSGAIDWLHSLFSRRVPDIHSSVPPTSD